MTTIESNEVSIRKPVAEVFAYISNLNNHQALMPDSIYNWSSTEDECKFTIQNMAKLELKVTAREPNTKLLIEPKSEAPFPLSLQWTLTETAEGTSARMLINADMNPFIKMMAVGPLTKLVNFQAEKLKEILEA